MYVLCKNDSILALCEKATPLQAITDARNGFEVKEIPALTVSEALNFNEKENNRFPHKRGA